VMKPQATAIQILAMGVWGRSLYKCAIFEGPDKYVLVVQTG
jgi:hypothetical protein